MTLVELADREAGFSLLETLVAVMILGVTLVVILQLFSGGLRAGDMSVNYTEAIFLAEREMEKMLLEPYLEDDEAEEKIDDVYSCRVVVSYIEPEEGSPKKPFDFFDVSVRVGWQEALSAKEVELNTIAIAKLPPEAGETLQP